MLTILIGCFVLFILSGCQSMVNSYARSSNKIQNTPPDFEKYRANVGKDENEQALFELISTLKDECPAWPSRLLTDEEKAAQLKEYEDNKENVISQLVSSSITRSDAIRIWKESYKKLKSSLDMDNSRISTRSFPGANRVSMSKQKLFHSGYNHDLHSFTIEFPCKSAAEANEITSKNYRLVKKLFGGDSDWQYIDEQLYEEADRVQDEAQKQQEKLDRLPGYRADKADRDATADSRRVNEEMRKKRLEAKLKRLMMSYVWQSKYKTAAANAAVERSLDSYVINIWSTETNGKFASKISVVFGLTLPDDNQK